MSFFYRKSKDKYGDERIDVRCGRIVAVVVLALFLSGTALGCFAIIPSGSTGVRTTFGQIDPGVVPNGFCWKIPFVQQIQKVNNKQQEIAFKDKIWGETSERTVVYMENVTVTYRINPEYSAWIYANVSDYRQNALPVTLVESAMKASMVALGDKDVTNRSRIEPIAVENLQSAIDRQYGGARVVQIINVNVRSMDFEESYNAAIAAKQVAELNLEKQKIENETRISAANAEADQRRIEANAEADQRVIAAQAEAESILAIAEAQAEANRELASSLTEPLIEYRKVEKWDGELPTVTGTGVLVGFDLTQGAD